MLAKVADRVMTRSAGRRSSVIITHPQEPVVQVHIAPELLRWSDFSTPFPSVSLGGYSRFYEQYTMSEQAKPYTFFPVLSQQPDPSPSSETPSKYPLFDIQQPSSLPIIRETSRESLSLPNPKTLTITTNITPPRSLKRRKGRLLRTPSVERDFGCHSSSETFTTIFTALASDSPSDIRSSSSSSSDGNSHERSDSNDSSEFPVTPSTSTEGEVAITLPSTSIEDEVEKEHGVVMFSTEEGPRSEITAVIFNESESETMIASPISPASLSGTVIEPQRHLSESEARPMSSISYCTAGSDFGETHEVVPA